MLIMKKGFTLIELLAVIIILAIIALIATPIILNVIDDVKKSAGLSEANMIYNGINNYCATSSMKNELDGSVDICADGVTIEEIASMVNLGNASVFKVSFSNDKVTELEVNSNGHTYTLQPDGSFSIDGEIIDPVEPEPEEPQIINFSLGTYNLDTYNYQAEEGMTFRQWIDSEYNVEQWVENNGSVCNFNFSRCIDGGITLDDVIVAGYSYYISKLA